MFLIHCRYAGLKMVLKSSAVDESESSPSMIEASSRSTRLHCLMKAKSNVQRQIELGMFLQKVDLLWKLLQAFDFLEITKKDFCSSLVSLEVFFHDVQAKNH